MHPDDRGSGQWREASANGAAEGVEEVIPLFELKCFERIK